MVKIDKAIGDRLTDVLMRSHDRRHQFLYTGKLIPDDRMLILGSHKEDDFKFGEAEQTIALMRFTEGDLWEEVKSFLTFFKIEIHKQPMLLVSLKPIFSILQKVKWDLDQLEITVHDSGVMTVSAKGDKAIPSAIYATPVSSYFTYVRLKAALPLIYFGLTDEKHHHDLPLDVGIFDSVRAIKQTLDPKDFKTSSLKTLITKPRSFILMKGRDLPTPKALVTGKKKEDITYQYALRIWNPDGKELCFGGYFQMPEFELLSGRLNVFLT